MEQKAVLKSRTVSSRDAINDLAKLDGCTVIIRSLEPGYDNWYLNYGAVWPSNQGWQGIRRGIFEQRNETAKYSKSCQFVFEWEPEVVGIFGIKLKMSGKFALRSLSTGVRLGVDWIQNHFRPVIDQPSEAAIMPSALMFDTSNGKGVDYVRSVESKAVFGDTLSSQNGMYKAITRLVVTTNRADFKRGLAIATPTKRYGDIEAMEWIEGDYEVGDNDSPMWRWDGNSRRYGWFEIVTIAPASIPTSLVPCWIRNEDRRQDVAVDKNVDQSIFIGCDPQVQQHCASAAGKSTTPQWCSCLDFAAKLAAADSAGELVPTRIVTCDTQCKDAGYLTGSMWTDRVTTDCQKACTQLAKFQDSPTLTGNVYQICGTVNINNGGGGTGTGTDPFGGGGGSGGSGVANNLDQIIIGGVVAVAAVALFWAFSGGGQSRRRRQSRYSDEDTNYDDGYDENSDSSSSNIILYIVAGSVIGGVAYWFVKQGALSKSSVTFIPQSAGQEERKAMEYKVDQAQTWPGMSKQDAEDFAASDSECIGYKRYGLTSSEQDADMHVAPTTFLYETPRQWSKFVQVLRPLNDSWFVMIRA